MNWNVFSLVNSLGWTLVHFVWQGILIAAVLFLLLWLGAKAKPNVRYVLSCLALGMMAATAAFTLAWQVASASSSVATIEPAGASIPESVRPEAAVAAVPKEGPVPPLGPPSFSSNHLRDATGIATVRGMLGDWLPFIVAVWGAGICLLSARLIVDWCLIKRIRSDAEEIQDAAWAERFAGLCERLGVRATVRFLGSARARVPFVFGWIKPAVLLPASALTGLDTQELEAILLHELAHIRRHDYLVNLAQTLIETLLFYHPAVWCVSRQIRKEREHCCDDLAAVSCGGGLPVYMRALTSLEEMRRLPGMVGVAANGASLKSRIQRLAGVMEPRPASVALPAMIALFFAAIVFSVAFARGRPEHGPKQSAVQAPENPTVPQEKDEAPADETLIRKHIAAMSSTDQSAQVAAALALRTIGQAAMPTLLEVLNDPKSSAGDRSSAAGALGAIGPKAKAAVPSLIEALKDRRSQPENIHHLVLLSAVDALGNIGPNSKSAVPALIELLQDPACLSDHRYIAKALGRIGPDAVAAVPALTKALGSEKEFEQHGSYKGEYFDMVLDGVADTLGAFGPRAKEAAPALARLLLRTGNISGEKPDSHFSNGVEAALGSIGIDAVPAIVNVYQIADDRHKPQVVRAFAAIGADKAQVLPHLLTALDDSDPVVRREALVAMTTIGSPVPAAKALAPIVARRLKDSDVLVRSSAASVLFACGPQAKEAVPALIAALDDDETQVRKEAAWALFAIGPSAKAAIPALKEAANDQDKQVRTIAAKALERVQSGVAPTDPDKTWMERFRPESRRRSLTGDRGLRWGHLRGLRPGQKCCRSIRLRFRTRELSRCANAGYSLPQCRLLSLRLCLLGCSQDLAKGAFQGPISIASKSACRCRSWRSCLASKTPESVSMLNPTAHHDQVRGGA